MELKSLLEYFILLPLAGFVISLLVPGKKEGLISWSAYISVGLHSFCSMAFIILWLMNGSPDLNLKDIVLFKTPDYEFFIDFYFDQITAVYLFVGCFLVFLVMIYSRYYLHREAGYKRFFNTVLF